MKAYEGTKNINTNTFRSLNNMILVPDELTHGNMYIIPHMCHTEYLNKTCWGIQKRYT
jgi:hypothetical protein